GSVRPAVRAGCAARSEGGAGDTRRVGAAGRRRTRTAGGARPRGRGPHPGPGAGRGALGGPPGRSAHRLPAGDRGGPGRRPAGGGACAESAGSNLFGGNKGIKNSSSPHDTMAENGTMGDRSDT